MDNKSKNKNLELSEEDNRAIADSFKEIKEVLNKKKINVKDIIGLVTTDEVNLAANQVDIRFAEEKTNVVMNMVAFD